MLSKIYGAIALLCLFLAPGAVESEMYLIAFAMIAGMVIFAYLSMKEDGQIRHKKKPHHLGRE